jgi:hypothetical protein
VHATCADVYATNKNNCGYNKEPSMSEKVQTQGMTIEEAHNAYKVYMRELMRARFRTNPEAREKHKLTCKKYYERRKAATVAATAAAITAKQDIEHEDDASEAT